MKFSIIKSVAYFRIPSDRNVRKINCVDLAMRLELFFSFLGIFCLSANAVGPDEWLLRKWKENEHRTWCTTKWSGRSTRIMALITSAGSHKLRHHEDVQFRVCRNEDRHCSPESLWRTSNQKLDKGGYTMIMSTITLPDSLVKCRNCVLQWRITTAAGRHSIWRTCHRRHMHQGRRQRRDIAEVTLGPPDLEWTIDSIDLELHSTPMTTPMTTPEPRPSLKCKGIGLWSTVPDMDVWCSQRCRTGDCPGSQCDCEETSKPSGCKATGLYTSVAGMDDWCAVNCAAGNCPSSHCICGNNQGPPGPECRSAGQWVTVDGMDEWCQHHCALNLCPPDRCTCD